MVALCARTVYGVRMETETADRFAAWCGTCQAVTESDDTTSRWCLRCGDRRSDRDN